MTFSAYVSRQRQKVAEGRRGEETYFFHGQSVPVNGEIFSERTPGDELPSAEYFARLSAKLFSELNALRGFRRDKDRACC